jgi:hypothetical protein
MYELTSKDLSWSYVDSSRRLSSGPCELWCAELDPSGAGAEATLYNGRSIAGDPITGIQAKQQTNQKFKPKAPVYCRRGLFVQLVTNCNGVFVQWREL